MLGTGIVNYIFETDTNSCVISYSCAQQHFYQVRYFTKDELDSYLADEKEQGAKRSLERVILDVKQKINKIEYKLAIQVENDLDGFFITKI